MCFERVRQFANVSMGRRAVLMQSDLAGGEFVPTARIGERLLQKGVTLGVDARELGRVVRRMQSGSKGALVSAQPTIAASAGSLPLASRGTGWIRVTTPSTNEIVLARRLRRVRHLTFASRCWRLCQVCHRPAVTRK